MTSTSGDLTSAIAMIGRFILDPAKYLSEWVELHWGNDGSLCGRIKAALQSDGAEVEAGLRALLEQTRSPDFAAALAHAATTAQVPGAEHRQRRNAEAIVRTALVARDAQRAARQDGQLCADAIKQLAEACQLLHFEKSQGSEERYAEPPVAADATEPVRRAFLALETDTSSRVSLAGMAAARYWINAWWLDKDEGYNADRLELPTVTIHSAANRHFLGSFIAYSRPTSRVAVLIEHPTIALLCLGQRLVDSIHDAWSSPKQKKTAVWKIKAHNVLAQDDESLGGAAAVIFHALSENSTLGSNVLVLARLNQDRNSLNPVGGVAEKINEALRHESLSGLSVVLGSATPPFDAASQENCGLTPDELLQFKSRIPISVVGSVREALQRAVLRSSTNSETKIGQYTPGKDLGSSPPHYQLCEANHPKESHLILKAWHIDEARRLLLRGSWDLEMRTLYRLCSLPRAEELLLTIKDSFVTKDKFVLVMRTTLDAPAGPPRTLPEALRKRSEHPWLRTGNADTAKGRHAIWQGLRRIAEGIRLLYSQNVVHRNLSAECVYFAGELNAKTLRLGGFEWSARVGASPGQAKPNTWATPPDAGNGLISIGTDRYGFGIDTDWYGFGMLAARCFHDLEELAGKPAIELNRRVAEIYADDRRAHSSLTSYERNLILKLIHPDRADRLKDPARIMSELDRVLSHLGPQAYEADEADDDAALYVICYTRGWSDRLKRYGFQPDKARPQEPYDHEDDRHAAVLKTWLKQRFRRALLIRQPSGELYLQGDQFALRLKPENTAGNAWTFARADVLESIGIPDQAAFYDLQGVPIVFLLKGKDHWGAFRDPRNWTHYFPAIEPIIEDRNKARESLMRFLRCTNQLDLLLCYAKIFPCKVEPIGTERNVERVRVIPRIMKDRGLPSWLRRAMSDVDLFKHFRPRLDAVKPEQRHVLLTRDDGIRIYARDARDDEWDLQAIEMTRGRASALVLIRQAESQGRVVLPRGEMFIRARDHYGQVELIDRRGKAIDQVRDFRYLMNALASPASVWMTTTLEQLPLNDKQTQAIDDNKQAVLLDVLSARPIYALQGPPGTGKTTLIAHLVRQILHEDQTAQILITAQAHGAVERLQETLQKIHTLDDDNPAVIVRLGIDDDRRDAVPQAAIRPSTLGLREQAVAILRNAREKLAKRFSERPPERSSVERDWIDTLDQMLEASVIGGEGKGADDFNNFQRLIRDGANIVLCTTSNRDLEEIAEGDKTFDWSIIEEAGKVHGFDLALPMRVGHRWLLVGDQKQLEAYDFDHFKEALQLDEINESTELLKKLHEKNPDLIDKEWPGEWEQMTARSGEADAFLRTASVWLPTFDRIYKTLNPLAPDDQSTQGTAIGSSVGLLINQYRMHPAIGKLITETYYRKDRTTSLVQNCTGTISDPIPKVVHGLDGPPAVKGLPIVWLDVPWCGAPGSPANVREQRVTSYWNQAEIDLVVDFCRQLEFRALPERALKVAVLSQYTAQKNRLQKRLKEAFPQGFGPGLEVKEGLNSQQAAIGELGFTHTVDSFQGNEADIVIVSLTRNNTENKLGFVKYPKRMNVLLSRAQRLLVLVGSWDFFQLQVKGIDREVDYRHELAHVKRMLSILEDLGRLPAPSFARLRFEKGAFRRVPS
jgi:hypothetical protein